MRPSFKRAVIIPILFIQVLLIIASCKQAETYTLKMRLKPGDTFTQDMTTDMNMKFAGISMRMSMNTACSFLVKASDTASAQLRMTYSKIKGSMKGDVPGMENMNTDSMMNASSSKLVGRSVDMTISRDNKILEVSGMDSLMNQNDMDSATKVMMSKMFDKDQFENLFGLMFSMYPKGPVKVGDNWNAETKTNLAGMDMKVKMKYTLKQVHDGVADIYVDGIIDGEGGMEMTGLKLKMGMKGGQKGTISINLSDGYLREGKYQMNVDANMEMMGQKIPLSMTGDIILKGN